MNIATVSCAFRAVALTLLIAVAGVVSAEPPSDADIDRLFEAARTRKMLEDLLPQIEAMQDQIVRHAAQGDLSPEQKQQIQAAQDASRRALQRTMDWDEMHAVYAEAYKSTFSKEDVQTMTEFYASPAGQNLLNKTPQLLENVFRLMETRMQPVLDELNAELEQALQPPPEASQEE